MADNKHIKTRAELEAVIKLKGEEAKARLSAKTEKEAEDCLLYTSPSPRDRTRSRMPSSA